MIGQGPSVRHLEYPHRPTRFRPRGDSHPPPLAFAYFARTVPVPVLSLHRRSAHHEPCVGRRSSRLKTRGPSTGFAVDLLKGEDGTSDRSKSAESCRSADNRRYLARPPSFDGTREACLGSSKAGFCLPHPIAVRRSPCFSTVCRLLGSMCWWDRATYKSARGFRSRGTAGPRCVRQDTPRRGHRAPPA